jgi:hypothetical protein
MFGHHSFYMQGEKQNVKKKLYFGAPSHFGWKLAPEMTSSEVGLPDGKNVSPTQRADIESGHTLSTPMAAIFNSMAKAVSQLQVGGERRGTS